MPKNTYHHIKRTICYTNLKDLTIYGGVILVLLFSSFVETSLFVISFPFETSQKSTLKRGISSTRKYLMNDDIYI
jgi:hypothetical protein